MDKRTIYSEFDNRHMQAGVLSVVIAFALSRGMQLHEVEEAIGHSVIVAIDPEGRIDEDSLPKLWKAIAKRESGKPLTLEIAKAAPYTVTAGLFNGFQFASNIKEALEFLISNRNILSDRLNLEVLRTNGDVSVVTGHPLEIVDSGLSNEMGMAVLWRFLKEITGNRIELSHVEFKHKPNYSVGFYESYFDASAYFSQDHCALVLEEKWLLEPIYTANWQLFKFAQKYFGELSTKLETQIVSSDVKRLQKAIVDNALSGVFSSRLAAAKAGMSLRSAQRVSESNGTSLKAMIELVRTNGAKKLLTNAELKIDTIADILGYSDDRAFRRAFKNWTGITPSAFRRKK
ncbi:MAG: helix-turn-helix domain-containing protein [Pseudomonadota bacterium]